ncbi:hypothetical protein C8P68_107183 [Mucilaginibacter yixingensis]|uniref:Uncharacterized protein n=1 Tax=Mucilaginibacter yixingensis TaxID=1295612 RepID=A0A2T5J6D8_9SPHI|nr:hypothetical protein [Mucilaginibacter yixingensis]PTQ94118.1 hypothetical protein C8P68_107183 [Mucilaginibacter yixingensis]
MDIKQYINSGALEVFATGAATPAEEQEVLFLKERYPEVREALDELEADMEHIAQTMAVTPPAESWSKIEAEINSLIVQEARARRYTGQGRQKNAYTDTPAFIDVESESSHMRVHKNWRWVLAGIFILGKIFLICAIYFYLENRQTQQQLQEIKQELKELHR